MRLKYNILLIAVLTPFLLFRPTIAAQIARYENPSDSAEKQRSSENMSSPYVPLDSWIYPAFERLTALGYVQTAYLGMRPWTRMECARLVQELGERMEDAENREAQTFYAALTREFVDEIAHQQGAANLGISVDSVYARAIMISGSPARDGFHFGQTLVNDFGRPYAGGFNAITGITAHAAAGPLSLSIRGEYQHAPAAASDPMSVLEATASQDQTAPLPNGAPSMNRVRLLEGSMALTIRNIQVSFGKQSLWLGPSPGGPFLFSNNAEPIDSMTMSAPPVPE